jgi:hypothetical protein
VITLTPNQEKAYGCATCFFKSYIYCFHPESLKKGELNICDEYKEFMLSFAGNSNSISVMLENFSIWQADKVSKDDLEKSKQLEEEIKRLKAKEYKDPKTIGELDTKRAWLKLFWSKANESVRKSLASVVDRTVKTESPQRAQISIQQMNIMMHTSAERLAEMEKKKLLEDKGEENGT